MQEKVMVDKHIDAEAVADVIGMLAVNVQHRKPRTVYRGQHADDEDFSHVLQHAWGEETTLFSADLRMIEKAITFREDLSKTGSEKCLRGVVILPPGRENQKKALQDFLSGKTAVITALKGVPAPKTLDDIYSQNVGVDLTVEHPRAVNLCSCPWEGKKA